MVRKSRSTIKLQLAVILKNVTLQVNLCPLPRNLNQFSLINVSLQYTKMNDQQIPEVQIIVEFLGGSPLCFKNSGAPMDCVESTLRETPTDDLAILVCHTL